MIEIIDKKRRAEGHTQAEIDFVVSRLMAGDVPDYQLSAWLMAVCINGLSLDETTWLTDAYVRSGQVLDLSSIDGVVVDKHSTGGVGDKTTLVLIPLLAAAGVPVAKLSGRGLGFTGGTVDKLEAIPGFHVALTNDEFIGQIRDIGVAISSQTSDLAPADGKIYALRDVTATVQSIPLIAASVVSKKIAAGAQVIVLDIKYGRGAFMENLADAQALAETCRTVGKRLGRHISTVISSMEQPLGAAIGHTLEVIETLETLKGRGPDDLRELCLTLGSVALVGAWQRAGESVTALQEDFAQARARQVLIETLDSGQALAKFKALVLAQSGNPAVVDDYGLMPTAAKTVEVLSPESGVIRNVDSLSVAKATKVLGGGRNTKDEPIDYSVGAVLHKKVGDVVAQGDVLVTLHVNGAGEAEAQALALEAFTFSEQPVPPPALLDAVVL